MILTKKYNVVVRQRPAIGDALLLAPLIEQIAETYNLPVRVVTDSEYGSGGLVDAFKHLPHVTKVEAISPLEWTTESNKRVDRLVRAASPVAPAIIRNAETVYDCNGDFIEYERTHPGNIAEYGIAEFWLRHHNLYHEGVNLLPKYEVRAAERQEVNAWIKSFSHKYQTGAKKVAVVLRAGDTARDWDFQNKAGSICDYLYTRGCIPITVDYIRRTQSAYAETCVGRKLSFVAAVLQSCDLVLTPDTGLLHLAEAVGTKSIALWGIMRPELRVKGYNCLVLPTRSLGYCTGDDRYDCQCPYKAQQWSCLRRITLSMIVTALEKALTSDESHTTKTN